METISEQQLSRISNALAELYALKTVDEFIVAAMRVLPPLVRSDVTSFNEVNYPERRMVCVMDRADAQSVFEEVRDDLDRLLHQNPLIEHYARTIEGPLKISDFISDGEWRNRRIYTDMMARVGANYQMALALPLSGEAIVAIAFNREHKDFDETDRAILAFLQPHVAQAYQNAARHTQALRQIETRQSMLAAVGARWIDLDVDFRIAQASEETLAILQENPRAAALVTDRLPPDIENWTRRVAADARSGAPVDPLRLQRPQGRLTVRIVALPDAPGLGLVVQHAQTKGAAADLESLGLSPRPAEVLYWLAQGKTNAEIAVILHISLRTVETHVAAILETLDVPNRTAAAMRAQSLLLGV